jgi:hypothetical protein
VTSLAASQTLQIDLRAFELELTPPEDPGVAAPLHQAWVQVVLHWHDQARHDALLGIAAELRSFAWVAMRYREHAGDAIADRQLERLRRAATAVMLATATQRPEGKKSGKLTTLLLALSTLVLLAVAGSKYMKSRLDRVPPPHPAAATVSQPDPEPAPQPAAESDTAQASL